VVDEQLPQVVRADEVVVDRRRDVVADHREADQRAGLGVVHRPRVGHRALLLVGPGEYVRHRIEVLVLAGATAQAHHRRAVRRVQNVAQLDPRHRCLLHVLARVYSPAAPRKYCTFADDAPSTLVVVANGIASQPVPVTIR
jgi:hypothetical protein